tara:strand:+ start:16 stop:393 length:378 start_codon:yes stop_codon:yes gene_type:complete
MDNYFKKLLSNDLKLKKESDIPSLCKQTIKGFIVLDAYAEELQDKYRNKIEERTLHMGRYNIAKKEVADIYNKEHHPIFRNIEEAYGFAEFSYGNQPFGATHTIHEVEIIVKPKILDINGGREED